MPVFRVVVEVRCARLPSEPALDVFGEAARDLAAALKPESPSIGTWPGPSRRTQSDYRAGPIAIEWMDAVPATAGDDASPATVRFVSGNTELAEGVLHLFRSRDKDTAPGTAVSDVVAVLAVPAYMSSADFLQFVAPHQPAITSIRMLRDAVATRSVALLRFRDPPAAQAFRTEYDRRPFSSMESETCQAVLVQSVEFLSPAETAVFPIEERVAELPTCPVCLERLDTAVTGVFSLVCRHTFHCRCLAKWADNSCPVCRYGRKPVPDGTHSECAVCRAHDNLWMCLICGNVGCSRYGAGHAASHFRESHHPFAMEVETQRVWDYIRDGYVHRLIASSVDGKLVELPGADDAPADGGERRTQLTEEKLETLALEFGNVLTTQLESQRLFYEKQLDTPQRDQGLALASLERRMGDLADQARTDREAVLSLTERLATSDKERAKLDARLNQLAAKHRDLLKRHQEEESLNAALDQNLAALKEQDAQKARTIADLEEQLRDIMFYMDSQRRVAESAQRDEIQEGVVVIPDAAAVADAGSSPAGRGSRRRRN